MAMMPPPPPSPSRGLRDDTLSAPASPAGSEPSLHGSDVSQLSSYSAPAGSSRRPPLLPAVSSRPPLPPPPPPQGPVHQRTLAALSAVQQTWPAGGRILVGNLPATIPPGTLVRLVQAEFSKFGNCVPGVFFGQHGPYAIVQYEEVVDAFDAESRWGVVVGGRHVRVELSNRV